MKLVAKDFPNEAPFDFPSGFGKQLIQAGLCLAYVENPFAPPVRQPANTFGSVVPADPLGDTPQEPKITAKCATCNQQIVFTGPSPSGAAQLRHKPMCTGGIEEVPRSIAADYLDHRRIWFRNRSAAPALDPLSQLRKHLRTGG